MEKLCIVTQKLYGGGCERVITNLANALVDAGVGVTIFTEQVTRMGYDLDPRVAVSPLSEGEKLAVRDLPRAYRKLRKAVCALRPDVVLALPEKVNVWTALALIGTGIPVVVSERNDPRRHPESRIKRLLRHLVYPFVRGFIFQTEQQAAYFSKAIRSRGIVLDNPVAIKDLPTPYCAERDKTVVGVGRLEKQKNFSFLINAFAIFHRSHPDWRLLLYGEGRLRPELTKEIAALRLESAVTLCGAVTDVPTRIRTAGIFVCSSDFEGLPNALIEALLLGLPCISTDCPVGGPASLIEDGVNGLIVPVADVAALERALCRIADDKTFAISLGKRAVALCERLEEGHVLWLWRDYLAQCAKR